MKYIFLIVFCGNYILNYSQNMTESDLIVNTKYGKVKGAIEKNSCVWRGVPFAKAPVGNLRFKAPVPTDSWEGIKNTTEFGNNAMQINSPYAEGKISEDCLYLNIWSPKADSKKRPVMVWIHGGGFSQCAGSNSLYNGVELVNKGDVVVVTINYRLGPLAFLYFDELPENKGEFESNLGIKDQIAALKWVNQNIELFGGDPNNITIFGQSSGATSCMTILSCPSAKGLFHKVIAESPSLNFWTKEQAKQVTKQFLSLVGITKNNMADLYKISADSLIKVADVMLSNRNNLPGIGIFSSTVDEAFLPHKPIDAIKSGFTKDIPLLIGTNRFEANIFKTYSRAPIPKNANEIHIEFEKHAPTAESRITSCYKNYPKKDAIYNLVTDGVFTMPCIKAAEAQTSNASTWMYRLDWESLPLKLKGLRTCHALELFFVFNSFKSGIGKKLTILTSKKKVYNLSSLMQDCWISFSKNGNPNKDNSTNWKPYDSVNRATMLFNKTSKVVNDPNAEQRIKWADEKFF